jgi:hypothetical protein
MATGGVWIRKDDGTKVPGMRTPDGVVETGAGAPKATKKKKSSGRD